MPYKQGGITVKNNSEQNEKQKMISVLRPLFLKYDLKIYKMYTATNQK